VSRLVYGHPLSGNTHKVRLLLGFLELAYEERSIDIPAGEQHTGAFRAINPMSQVPVLIDTDGTRLRDSQAILVYLGGRYGAGFWWPSEPTGQGAAMQWLSFAANELHHGPNLARLHFLLGAPVDLHAAQALARRSLQFLDKHLSERDWLEVDRPTVADCAVFPYVALAPEGGIELDQYPAVVRWLNRCRALPGFVRMAGL